MHTEAVGLPLLNGPTEFGGHHPLPVQFTNEGRKLAKAGDLLFCVRGSTTGRMNWADQTYAIGRGVAAVRHKEDVRCQPFVRATIEAALPQLLAAATGSTFPNVSRDQLLDIEVPPMGLGEQLGISEVLASLDDKIELNRRMNETLEAMARALFRSWFVDFDPVRAKSEGRPTGLPADLDALFPSEFEDSPLGEIPRGWRAGSFGDEFYLLMGQSPPGDTYNAIGDGLPFFQGKTDFGFRFPSNRIYCSAPTRIAEPGQILISVRAPVGDVNVAIEKSAIGRGVAAAIHKSQSASYTLHTLTELRSQFKVFDGEGTVFGSINKADFQKLVVMVPSEEIVSCFEAMCQPLDDAVLSNEREIRGLAITRDELLPKLLYGEIEVADVEGRES